MTTSLSTNMTDADQFTPYESTIAALAYRLWTKRGRPSGSPEEDWFAALYQIKHSGRSLLSPRDDYLFAMHRNGRTRFTTSEVLASCSIPKSSLFLRGRAHPCEPVVPPPAIDATD